MNQCAWCFNEVGDDDLVVLDLDMPKYNGPYMRIRNNLCPDCSLKARTALAVIELQQRANHDDQADDQENPGKKDRGA